MSVNFLFIQADKRAKALLLDAFVVSAQHETTNDASTVIIALTEEKSESELKHNSGGAGRNDPSCFNPIESLILVVGKRESSCD